MLPCLVVSADALVTLVTAVVVLVFAADAADVLAVLEKMPENVVLAL